MKDASGRGGTLTNLKWLAQTNYLKEFIIKKNSKKNHYSNNPFDTSYISSTWGLDRVIDRIEAIDNI